MRRLLVLLVLAAAVAAYLFLWDLPREREQIERDTIERQLMTFHPSRVDTLRIDRAEGRLSLARADEEWWMLEPVHERADGAAVERQLQALSEAERVRPLAPEDETDNLAVYGLAGVSDGTAVVQVTSVGGQTTVLHVGQTNPWGTATYVQRGPGAPVELAEAALAGLVRAPHHSFRQHDLFAVDYPDVVAVQVTAGDVSYAARRDDEGLWYLDEPNGRRLRRWLMKNLAYDIATVRVRTFVADHLTERDWRAYGLHEPVADVRFQAGDGWHRIRIGNEGEDQMVFGRRDDETTVFLFPPQLLKTAETPLAQLLDASPLPFDFDRLESVHITWESGESFGLARAEAGWEPRPLLDDPVLVESLRTPMRNVVYGLERTQSKGTMLLAPDASAASLLERQPVRCELVWPERTVVFTLGWRAGEEDHWLHVEGARELFQVPRDLYFRLRGYLVSAGRLEL